MDFIIENNFGEFKQITNDKSVADEAGCYIRNNVIEINNDLEKTKYFKKQALRLNDRLEDENLHMDGEATAEEVEHTIYITVKELKHLEKSSGLKLSQYMFNR
jgi:hypothetical protein